MNRSPAFQFYPDKWQSHTRRLSDSSYRVFHELVCWMWQHSPDYCSIQASAEAVACATAMPLECVRVALADINNAFAPLLKTDGDRWICNGLRKEAAKQEHRSGIAKAGAVARWKDAGASKTDADASFRLCTPSPSPSPTPLIQRPSKDELPLTGDSSPPFPTKREAHASDKKKNKGTQAELEAYAEDIDLEASDGAFMFEHWESNGWRNGSAPVKDWRAGMRKWKAGGWFPSQKQVFNGRRNGNPQDQSCTATGF